MCYQLDDWVLCRIYKKKHIAKALEQKEDEPNGQINIVAANVENERQMMKLPRTYSITHLLDMDYLGPISQILQDGSYGSTFDFQINTANAEIDPFVRPQLVEMPNHYAADSGKFQVKQSSSTVNQPIFMNQVYEHQPKNDIGLFRF